MEVHTLLLTKFDYPVSFKMSSEEFSLSWGQFGSSIKTAFKNLLNDQHFTDVTLVSEDNKQIKAHKVILSSSSKFFNQILLDNPHQHPLLFLKGISHSDLLAIVKFIYLGQTEVAQDDLNEFMGAAKVLQVQGLNETQEHIKNEYNPEQDSKPQNDVDTGYTPLKCYKIHCNNF